MEQCSAAHVSALERGGGAAANGSSERTAGAVDCRTPAAVSGVAQRTKSATLGYSRVRLPQRSPPAHPQAMLLPWHCRTRSLFPQSHTRPPVVLCCSAPPRSSQAPF